MSRVQRIAVAAGLVGALAAVTGCASSTPDQDGRPTLPPPPSALSDALGGGGTDVSVTVGEDDAALNYDKQLVPDGAKLFVAAQEHGGLTTVVLDVRGLQPNRAYGAHAHAKPCGAKPDDAGPHFQHVADPVKPSVDPKFANPDNEIWLDFTTDAQGNATSASTVDWTFGESPAGSVVLHVEPTKTAPGQAGVAGARAACVSVGF